MSAASLDSLKERNRLLEQDKYDGFLELAACMMHFGTERVRVT